MVPSEAISSRADARSAVSSGRAGELLGDDVLSLEGVSVVVTVTSGWACSGWEAGEVGALVPAQPVVSAAATRTGRSVARCFLMVSPVLRGEVWPVPGAAGLSPKAAFGFLTRDCTVRAQQVKGRLRQ